MAPGAPPMEGLQIRPLNIEKGSERFSFRSDDEFPPQTASWRNNLIAFSQRRNLMFAACSHRVYVWEPAGASQTLGRKPAMIITPVMKNPESAGYIAPYFPHAINNMLVGDLGLEEVLLLVTDSGNVCGYRVEAIFSALERASQENAVRPLNDAQVYPFFVEYVESSAWGLAIHKFARQIAVTSNTGLITVFAFALVDPGVEGDLSSDHAMGASGIADNDQPWYNVDNSVKFWEVRSQMRDTFRLRNMRMTYTGHFTNIPSVSFLNSDLDPNGTWMLSTDIDNKLIVWKVWESLNPFNVFHFNDSTFHFVPGMLGNEDRGWTVLALDPRTFRRAATLDDACGGRPQLRVKDGHDFIDISKLTNHIPDASHLYNYFPPAVRAEPERPTIPDIFSPDCQIDSRSDFTHYPDEDKATPHAVGDTENNASIGSTVARNLHPSDSTDAFSHSAVDGSAGQPSQGISPEADAGTENQQAPNLSAGDASGNGVPAPLADIIDHLSDTQAHAATPMTTADFLQLALIEGLGGREEDVVYDEGAGFADSSESDENDDEDMGDADENEEMDESEEGDQESDDDDHWGFDDYVVGPRMRGVAYNALDRMCRSAFPNDPDPYGVTETLISSPLLPASPLSNFPILHFSQTDIRLIPHPFASHHTVACYAPLRQPFTNPVASIRACDRFNMVQYIPEHGIVVAVSQKGRAAVISLTESDEAGLAFRVDWIVPFESQEKYGDRPLVPLLGMSVSPIQGFELPPDIPYIPRGEENLTDLAFRYRLVTHDDDDDDISSPDIPSGHHHTQDLNLSDDTQAHNPEQPNHAAAEKTTQTTTTDPEASDTEPSEEHPQTNAERHAWASRIYRPDEPWRGWNKSRHYRLLLMYADHTVMTYEFWYGENTGDSSKGEGDGGDGVNEDPYLMI